MKTIKPAQKFPPKAQQKNNLKPNINNQTSAFHNSYNSQIFKNRQGSLDVLAYKDGSFDSIPYNEKKLTTVKSAVFKKLSDSLSKDQNASESQRNSSKNYAKFSGQNWKEKINPQVFYYYQQLLKNQKSNLRKGEDSSPDLTPINNTQLSLKADSKKQIKIFPNSHQNFGLWKNQYFDIRNNNRKRRQKKDQAFNFSPKSEVRFNRIEKEQNHQQCIKKMKEQVQKVKHSFENKLTGLQYQNRNLKDELFYLRAAILSKYETNQLYTQNK